MALDPVQLVTFQAVINEGSFEAAARSLHVTPSAVSQRIKALEQAVGQVLVRRGKPCEPTEAGTALVRLAGQTALLEREALDAARGPVAGGHTHTRVAVVVNADSLATWFLPALAALTAEGGLAFDIHQDDQDHTADILRAGTAMAAVTAQQVPVQGCRVERLGAMRYLAMAAPALRRAHFAGTDVVAGFATAPMIVLNRKDRLQHRFLGTLTERTLDPPIHYVPAAAAFVEAVRLGLGWGLVPERIAVEDIAAGRCVDLTPGRHLDVPLYWQYWRLESTVLTTLTTAVRAGAATALR
ncbi:LysR family transcriptional regulator ArgP [Polymorphospora sp. NPDC050346]|uniref:LysR family transcriptional regulator ArgP n=1 Tax=Polymorphospora sp. NPDC050346 TaxID=3155780 RepID=UPI0033E755E9